MVRGLPEAEMNFVVETRILRIAPFLVGLMSEIVALASEARSPKFSPLFFRAAVASPPLAGIDRAARLTSSTTGSAAVFNRFLIDFLNSGSTCEISLTRFAKSAGSISIILTP